MIYKPWVKIPLKPLISYKNNVSNTKTAIAGGIKLTAAEEIKSANPDLLIIGGAISTVDDPATAAAEFKKLLG